MILVCEELNTRLDHVWYQLQRLEQERCPGISQIDLDIRCVVRLEERCEQDEADNVLTQEFISVQQCLQD